MARPRVFVTRAIPEFGLRLIQEHCDVEVWSSELPPSKAELLRGTQQAVGLLCLLTDAVDANLIASAPNLRVISNCAVGVDNVDLRAATARRIPVGNTPDVLTDATADLTFALLLASARHIVEAAAYVKAGRWKTWNLQLLLGADLVGATLGIVGFGRIGKAVARRAQGFGLRILYCDPSEKPDWGAVSVDMDTLLAEADFVSVHVPLTSETAHMFNAATLAKMKPSSILINTARGPIVDPKALYGALKVRRLAAAALDVTEPEPIEPDSPLLELDNCIVLPHLGSASNRTREQMVMLAVTESPGGPERTTPSALRQPRGLWRCGWVSCGDMPRSRRASRYLAAIYGPEIASRLADKLDAIYRKYEPPIWPAERGGLTERDVLLITYPDQVRAPGILPLTCLAQFCARHVKELVTGIHLLPFFPSSSDDGFSVIDYRKVDASYGNWGDIKKLGQHYRLMFDAVINHVSAKSDWFQAWLRGEPAYRDYFIRASETADLSNVVRPRAQPLLTHFQGLHGDSALWTTFGPDQIDLNYGNPEVLLAVIDLLLFYARQGASFIRLDAVAYLWKEVGTSCVHRSQTHMLVRLFRAIIDDLAPHVTLLTETNVPQAENLRYFGNGKNEAHLVYNFALASLVLHAFQTGQARVLTAWARDLAWPSEAATYFNVLASHDGIGLNPVRGILSEDEIQRLVGLVEELGGLVSRKSNPDGTSSPYEINANYFDALKRPREHLGTRGEVERFVTAHAILLAFKGLPGLYFHSLVGSRGWPAGVNETGRKRSINREKLDEPVLTAQLSDPGTVRSQVYGGLANLLKARRMVPSFSPHAPQRILHGNDQLFAFVRGGDNSQQQVLCIHNVTGTDQPLRCDEWASPSDRSAPVRDLIGGASVDWRPNGVVMLRPFQSMWLTTQREAERS